MSPAAAAVRDTVATPAGGLAAPAPRAPRRQGPRLAVVAPPPVRSRGPFALVCAALLAGTLVSLLLLNIALSRGSYREHELEQRRADLADQQQALSERLAAEAAPGRLAQRAAALGMVSNPNPVFLRLSDGAVLGAPTPAPALPSPPPPAPPSPPPPAPPPPPPAP
jgi:hypothetical protein